MKKLKFVLSLPSDTSYLHEQAETAKAAAERLGVELQVFHAKGDPIIQSQQLLEILQSRSTPLPDGIIIEPASPTGLPQVAAAAVDAGIGWVVSNASVDYLGALRGKSKVPVFTVSQDHVEIGRIQGRQMGALLPQGGSVLYLRGPSTNSLACKRTEGMESTKPGNIQLKTLNMMWNEDSACNSLSSWLRLSTVRAAGTQLISSQGSDFITAARKAFLGHPENSEREKWLTVPHAGTGTLRQTKPLVDKRVLQAAAVTSATTDTALEMLVSAIRSGSQPPERTFVASSSYPSLEELAARRP
jgi:ribose transport system substrate-binding protein